MRYSRRRFTALSGMGLIGLLSGCLNGDGDSSIEVVSHQGGFVEPGLYIVTLLLENPSEDLETFSAEVELDADGLRHTQTKEITIGAETTKQIEFPFMVDEDLSDDDVEYGLDVD